MGDGEFSFKLSGNAEGREHFAIWKRERTHVLTHVNQLGVVTKVQAGPGQQIFDSHRGCAMSCVSPRTVMSSRI